MIVSALLALCLTAPAAAADSDFTLEWSGGEVSRDASHHTTTWTLVGATLTHDSTGSGHVLPAPDTHKTTTVRAEDLEKIAECLVEADAAVKKVKGKTPHEQGRFTTVKYTHGKQAIELYFPYWLDDEVHRPKSENKQKLEAVQAIDHLRGKLFDIEG